MKLETTRLEITGDFSMHCGGCERTVKFALKTLPGIQQVEASHKTQHIQIDHIALYAVPRWKLPDGYLLITLSN